MRIGIDFDGTISDTNAMKARWIRDHLGMEVAQSLCDRTACVPIIGLENYERLSPAAYEREGTLSAPPIAGVAEALQRLSAVAELFLLTARKPHRVAFAEEWLDARGLLRCFSAIMTSDGEPKHALCVAHGLRALVDDDARHIIGLDAHGVRGILFKACDARIVPGTDGVRLCRTWPQVVATLVVVD